jgi:hypothetical protein
MATQMKKIALVFALILGTAAPMLTQSANATLSGLVRDSEGAVIPQREGHSRSDRYPRNLQRGFKRRWRNTLS